MVATKWEWDVPFMLNNFYWRAFLILIVTASIILFRKSLGILRRDPGISSEDEDSVEATLTDHRYTLLFLAWTVFTLHHPALFIGGFLMFIAFTIAMITTNATSLKSPLLVGFFAGLYMTVVFKRGGLNRCSGCYQSRCFSLVRPF